MQQIALDRDGLCLSQDYVNSKTKLAWQCINGHIWKATPQDVKMGTWCPICSIKIGADKQKSTIEQMKELATKRGGYCLSKKYVNTNIRLEWECNKGHSWWATPKDVVRGTWCPVCGGSLKKTLEEMQKIAEERAGKCLSPEYINSKTKLKWQCKIGHIWETKPDNVLMGRWCPYCAGVVKLTIEEMQTIAIERGGLCLSTHYVNGRQKLKWQCKEGHIWEAVPDAVKRGSWCPTCAAKNRGITQTANIQEMQVLAQSKNGMCLSKNYINSQTKLQWQCKEGHIWEARPNDIKQGQWCPTCGLKKSVDKKRLHIEDLQELARNRDGMCLSTHYINNRTHLRWQCKEGHIWNASADNIKAGKWCPICGYKAIGEQKRLTIEEMKKIAEQRDGRCLSKQYFDAHTKLRWQCKEGHIWKSTPMSIRKGSWCPKCSEHISERICRKIFENIFNERFPKKRPDWLKRPNGRNMELDGYCSKLGIAFEYQGEQHYKDVLRYDGKRSLDQQKELDEFKRRKCEEHTVFLIEVPFSVDYEKMPNFIIDECKKKNIMVPKITKTLDYKLLNIYSPEKLKELQEIAKERGGFCLSKRYVNSQTKLQWKCKEGHIWEAGPSNIKTGHWCPSCYGNVKLSIEEMYKLAEEKGGKCLSENYNGINSKLKWQCKEGHIWETTPSKIKRGSWCPVCVNKRKGVRIYTIKMMNDIASKRMGKCLSDTYNGYQTKLKWQCEHGHKWEATPGKIVMGRWCPTCAVINRTNARRGNIEEMQSIAKERGGLCLSTKYIESHSKLKWQCKEGHTWEATPASIIRGSWCRFCEGNYKLTINDMHEIALQKGGKCLSEEYVNVDRKLKWQCKEGHVWETTPDNIKSGHWCPKCSIIRRANSQRSTIEKMREIAEKRGGKCLSNEYVNNHTKIKWQCAEGHTWLARPTDIISNKWCPICAKNRMRRPRKYNRNYKEFPHKYAF